MTGSLTCTMQQVVKKTDLPCFHLCAAYSAKMGSGASVYGLFTGSEYCTVDWTFDSAFEWFKIVIPAEEACSRYCKMAQVVFVVRALSPRDGGWKRVFRQFRTGEEAWLAVTQFWPLMVLSGDYVTVEVLRTVSFRRLRRVLTWGPD